MPHQNNHQHHTKGSHITWPTIIILILAFVPISSLIIALIAKWPLPTVPFVNLTGKEVSEEYEKRLSLFAKQWGGMLFLRLKKHSRI